MGTSTPEISQWTQHPQANRRQAPPQIPDHQLVRIIGRGSYGEVWLAKNVHGRRRAVKVVYRENLDDASFEREFRGIKEFEPFSRKFGSQVEILHVGRNDSQGYFYYVMELADDANPDNQTDEAYRPRTLRQKIQNRGPLPVLDCIDLGLALADALEVLHTNGLLHRDIKPSNIIFIGGSPRLADSGLVTRADDAHSIVGTYGFVPPEGPGTRQADIFGLGMVLYEASTGEKASEFPRPVSDLRQRADFRAWLELNEIILKACASDARNRYQTTRDLRSDLLMLKNGKSVRAKYKNRRRLAIIGAVLLCVISLYLMVLGICSLWNSAKGFGHGHEQVPSAVSNDVGESRLKVVKTLEVLGVPYWPSALLGKWKRYPESLLFLPTDQSLKVISTRGYLMTEKLMPLSPGVRLSLDIVSDIDSDGSDEVVVSGREGDELFISVLDSSLTEIKRFRFPAEKRETRSGVKFISGMWAKQIIDLDGTGKKRLLALMGTAFMGPGPKPRAVLCFDYETQQLLWKYEIGGFGTELVTCDINSDGGQEIIVGTDAVDNGNLALDGSNDNRANLYILRSDGHLLWRRDLSGYYTRVNPLVVRQDDSQDPYPVSRVQVRR